MSREAEIVGAHLASVFCASCRRRVPLFLRHQDQSRARRAGRVLPQQAWNQEPSIRSVRVASRLRYPRADLWPAARTLGRGSVCPMDQSQNHRRTHRPRCCDVARGQRWATRWGPLPRPQDTDTGARFIKKARRRGAHGTPLGHGCVHRRTWRATRSRMTANAATTPRDACAPWSLRTTAGPRGRQDACARGQRRAKRSRTEGR